jgi:hypothetical protein
VSFYPEGGFRLAALTDGEGHFAIIRAHKRNTGTLNYSCAFAINVRADDLPLLERFHDALGLGQLYVSDSRGVQEQRPNNRPMAAWRVHNQADCLALVELFETYPLWSKKQRDFAIWAKAVRYWNSPKPDGWAPMAQWWEEIRAVREYESIEIETLEEATLSASLF